MEFRVLKENTLFLITLVRLPEKNLVGLVIQSSRIVTFCVTLSLNHPEKYIKGTQFCGSLINTLIHLHFNYTLIPQLSSINQVN